MNNNDHCSCCGSTRVASGTLQGPLDEVGRKTSAFFVFEEDITAGPLKARILGGRPELPVNHVRSALLCLACGRITTVLCVDKQDADDVVLKWGTETLKAKLRRSGEA